MAFYIATRHHTRFSDLDTQRHVTSRTYESFATDARFQLMEREGLALRELVESSRRIEPEDNYVRFVSQQWAGAELVMHTFAYPEDEGRVFWSHSLEQTDGTPVCHLVTRTRARDEQGEPLAILPAGSPATPVAGEIPERFQPAQIHATDAKLLEPIPAFSGNCKRMVTRLPAIYSGRDIFGGYTGQELWRVFEDGRWFFSEGLGLTYDRFVELDTTMFFMGAVFRYERLPIAGDQLEIHTWAESFDKIRAYLRQDVYVAGQDEPIMSNRENSLVVSLSRSRPRRPPPEYIEMVRDYLEYP